MGVGSTNINLHSVISENDKKAIFWAKLQSLQDPNVEILYRIYSEWAEKCIVYYLKCYY